MTNSIYCPVCENLCSAQAVACPKCGHPINKIKQSVQTENKNSTQPSSSTGRVLRGVLWVFFAISIISALRAIRIWIDMPRSAGTYSDSIIFSSKIAIAYHIAPLIVIIIVLAIVYSAKERK